MMRKLLVGAAITLSGLLLLASCAAPAKETPAPTRMPAVAVTPNVVAPLGSMTFIGANFQPKERIKLVYTYPPLKEGLEPVTSGFYATADAVGAFSQADQARDDWPKAVVSVIVYDSKDNAIASTVFMVLKPPAPAK